jgi:hypothetical protein
MHNDEQTSFIYPASLSHPAALLKAIVSFTVDRLTHQQQPVQYKRIEATNKVRLSLPVIPPTGITNTSFIPYE